MARPSSRSGPTHREQVISRIYDATGALIEKMGYDDISIADVAEACGMSRTAMYNYFADKTDLLIGYVTHETEGYILRLDDALRPVDNPVDQLRTYIRLQLEYFSDNHLPPGPELRLLLPASAAAQAQAHVMMLEERLTAIVRAGRDRRYLVADDVPSTVAMISACIGRASAVKDETPLEEQVSSTEEFVLRAVGVRLDTEDRPRKLPRR